MSRTPGALCLNPNTGSARARAWRAMRGHSRRGRAFTLDGLLAEVAADGRSTTRTNLRKYLTALVRAGILEVTDTRNGKASAYRMIRNVGPLSPVLRSDGEGVTDPNAQKRREAAPVAPEPRARRSRAWAVMRAFAERRQGFTLPDVMERTSVCSPSGRRDIGRYLAALVATGYLDMGRHGATSRYRLIRDTGPAAPFVRRDGRLYDFNEGCYVDSGVSA